MLLAQCGRDPVLEAHPAAAEAGRIPLESSNFAAINRFSSPETNADLKPFVWTGDPDRLIAPVRRGIQVLESMH